MPKSGWWLCGGHVGLVVRGELYTDAEWRVTVRACTDLFHRSLSSVLSTSHNTHRGLISPPAVLPATTIAQSQSN